MNNSILPIQLQASKLTAAIDFVARNSSAVGQYSSSSGISARDSDRVERVRRVATRAPSARGQRQMCANARDATAAPSPPPDPDSHKAAVKRPPSYRLGQLCFVFSNH